VQAEIEQLDLHDLRILSPVSSKFRLREKPGRYIDAELILRSPRKFT